MGLVVLVELAWVGWVVTWFGLIGADVSGLVGLLCKKANEFGAGNQFGGGFAWKKNTLWNSEILWAMEGGCGWLDENHAVIVSLADLVQSEDVCKDDFLQIFSFLASLRAFNLGGRRKTGTERNRRHSEKSWIDVKYPNGLVCGCVVLRFFWGDRLTKYN